MTLIFFFSSRIKDDWKRYRLLNDEVKELEQRNSNIQREKEKLEKLLKEGKQEEALEYEARLMLGLKKSGEEVIMVLPTENFSNVAEQQNSTSSDSLFEKSSNQFVLKISQIWYSLISKLKK
jgi:predicted transcriptional regulator